MEQANKRTSEQANKSLKAFTLIEVIFVFAIIAILLAILLPGMGTIKRSVQKLRDVSHLQKIRGAWYEAVVNRGWETGDADAPTFAAKLAGMQRTSLSDMILNDPHVYVSPGDKYASEVVKEAICYVSEGDIIRNYPFAHVDHFMLNVGAMPFFSYCLITNLPANAPLDTTPFAFTRGLRADGKWDEKAGLYGSSGGYVIYCDGHVVWFDGSKPAKFLKWDKSGYTNDIRQVVPNYTWMSCGHGVKTDYTSDGSLVILFHYGTGGA
ncbi:MAG: prepilin-type N-terminal cleavage/methylation domain-containing protein [Puniceicoccales bacterium]|jgi:hypothetical protein|nr:prepilin-type N-terminal cleavage/methylation domain-containing protein [Puniceicoccales bacterium]